jgi:hypothetical protein
MFYSWKGLNSVNNQKSLEEDPEYWKKPLWGQHMILAYETLGKDLETPRPDSEPMEIAS